MRFFDDQQLENLMNMKTGAVMRRAAHPAHPAITNAIVLIEQSAQDLADCVSLDGKPDWGNEPEARAAYNKDLDAAADLRAAQAEIEAPLQARIKALEGSTRTSAEENILLRALNAEMLAALSGYLSVMAAAGGGDKQIFMTEIRKADDKARAVIAKSAQPTIIHLPADNTEGGAL